VSIGRRTRRYYGAGDCALSLLYAVGLNMPRGRLRKQSGLAKGPRLKRAASPATPTPLRQSKRIRPASTNPASATPRNSQHYEGEDEGESSSEGNESGYEDEDASASQTASPSESEDVEDDEDERPRRRKTDKKAKQARGMASTPSAKNSAKKELWREGVKSDLAPGQEVFIELPKARQPGKTPYQDDKIHQNTFLFLNDLRANNQRAWLKVHDADFRQSERDWFSFVTCLTEELMAHDETIPELPPKDLAFRIYRDVRFSKDPTPYKTHFSAAWSRTGRKGPYAHYYLQIEPKNSFVGGGIWCPGPGPIALMRDEIDRRPHRLKQVLVDDGIRREFLNGVKKDEKQAVEAFIKRNEANALKTRPQVWAFDLRQKTAWGSGS
jgi:uncharacterized protein (TIGR02453 family)